MMMLTSQTNIDFHLFDKIKSILDNIVLDVKFVIQFGVFFI